MNRFRGLIHSQRVLLALTQKGVSREDAYALVQRNAMKVWEAGRRLPWPSSRPTRRCGRRSREAEIEAIFDLGYHTKHVDTIFAPGLRRTPERGAGLRAGRRARHAAC